MKTLTTKEPHSSNIANLFKTIETRTWQTKYRGLILLHCAKFPQTKLSGYAFGVVNLVEIRPMRQSDELDACCKYQKELFSWIIKDFRQVKLFKLSGKLRLFETPDSLVKYV